MTTTTPPVLDESVPLTKRQDFKRNFWVLLAAFLGMFSGVLSLAGLTVGPSTPFFEEAYGWSRATSASLISIAGVAAGLAGIGFGFLIDRFNLRAVVSISIVLLAATQVALAFVFMSGGSSSAVQLLFGVASIGGAGTTVVAYSRAVAGRFTSARGIALGMMGLGAGIASILFPLLIATIIPAFGIPTMYFIYAVLVLLPLPIVLATFHANKEVRAADEPVAQVGKSRFAVLKTSVFWRLFIVFTLLGAFGTTVTGHTVPALVDRGILPVVAAGAMSALGIGSILGRFVSGFLYDSFPVVRIAKILFALALPALPVVVWGPLGLVFAATFLAGLAIGSESDFLGYYLSRRIGVANLGFTMAFIYAGFSVLGSPMALISGLIYEATGSYDLVAFLLTGAMVLAIVILFTLPAVRPVSDRRSRRAAASVPEPAIGA